MKSTDPTLAKQMAVYAVVLSAVLGIPGVCIAAGWYLMKKYHWPAWTILFPVIIGMAGAFFQIYRYMQVRWANENSDSANETKH